MTGGPFLYYYAVLPALYYSLVLPLYYVGYFLVIFLPYYLIVVPLKFIGYYIGVGFVKLMEYLATFGILKSIVTSSGSTIYKVLSTPFIEFVLKPLQFIFGEVEAKYAIGLIIVPFVLVTITAIVKAIKKCRKADEK